MSGMTRRMQWDGLCFLFLWLLSSVEFFMLCCLAKILEFTSEQEVWLRQLRALKQVRGANGFLGVLETGTIRSYGLPSGYTGDGTEDGLVSVPVFSAKYGKDISAVIGTSCWDALWMGAIQMGITPTTVESELELLPDWRASGYYPAWYLRGTEMASVYSGLHDSCYERGSFVVEWSPLLQKVLRHEELMATFATTCTETICEYSRDLLIRAGSNWANRQTERFTFHDHNHVQQFSQVLDVLDYGSDQWS